MVDFLLNETLLEIPEKKEREFPVTVSQTLSKGITVTTEDYELTESGIDTSDTDWKEAFMNENHYTPLELIGMFANYLKNEIKHAELPKNKKIMYGHLVRECSGWTEDDYEIINEEV